MVSSVCFGWAFGRGAGRECDVLAWESSSFGAVGVGGRVGGRQGGQRVEAPWEATPHRLASQSRLGLF